MAHKEKKGYFPEEEGKEDPLEATIVNTNPQTLGLSLINNTVNTINQNPLPGHVRGVAPSDSRAEEVVLGKGNAPVDPPSRTY